MTSVRLNRAAIDAWAKSDDAKKLLDALGEGIAGDAADAAPRRSGALAESITHEVGVDSDGAYVRVSWDKAHFYGLFVELGTSKMPARPFLRPAAEKRRNL